MTNQPGVARRVDNSIKLLDREWKRGNKAMLMPWYETTGFGFNMLSDQSCVLGRCFGSFRKGLEAVRRACEYDQGFTRNSHALKREWRKRAKQRKREMGRNP